MIPFNSRSLFINLDSLLNNSLISSDFKFLYSNSTSILNISFMGGSAISTYDSEIGE